jgi:outer membrane protein OmpA-like peptidoglycan-associated protein/tetratricopeptide (TPR) repeat protein
MISYFRYFIVGAVLFLSLNNLHASPKKGDRYFKNFYFSNAVKVYEKYLAKHENDTVTIEKLATSYRLLNDWENAEKWYRKLIDLGSKNPDNLLYYANALRANQKYLNSNEIFQTHHELTGNSFSKNLILEEKKISDLLNFKNIEISNLKINTIHSDFAPLLVGNKLYFTSNRNAKKFKSSTQDYWKGSDFLNVYTVDTTNQNSLSFVEVWSLGKINGKYHEGPLALHPNGDLYLTRTNYKKNKAEKSTDKTAKLKVYLLKKDGNTWSQKLTDGVAFNNKEYSISHPTFNEDGSIMYFVSDMPGGFGKSDVWKATFDGKTYSNPVNLGPSVNTQADELFPHFYNGNLYFSSAGWPGLGGLDIFESKLDDSKPSNLGAPFNSNYDDFAILKVHETAGYFSSNRPGVGSDDIYKFTQNQFKVNFIVYDIKTNLPVEGAKISFNELASNHLVSDKNGEAVYFSLSNDITNLVANLDGYFHQNTLINFDNSTVNVGLKKLESDDVLASIKVLDFENKFPLKSAIVKTPDNQYITDDAGQVTFLLKKGELINLIIEKELADSQKKYFPVLITSVSDSLTNMTTFLRKFEKNKEFTIEDIYYDTDLFSINSNHTGQLNNLVSLMKQYPSIKVELRSYTDCRHTKEYNMILSSRRANSAKDFLVKNGINESRITFKGFGEKFSVNGCDCEAEQSVFKIGLKEFRRIEDSQISNCSEGDLLKNRRTTFIITEF